MFQFKRVFNATTGDWYYISCARLESDEYDWTEGGGNAFLIDLEPLREDKALPLRGLTLSVSNNGAYAMLTKNLDKSGSTYREYSEELRTMVTREDMVDCVIERDLLIVTVDEEASQ